MYKSPSITINEIDDSGFAITESETSVMVVGYATKGPIGVPVKSTTKNEFLEKFGTPPKKAPWSHLAAQKLFSVTNNIFYFRVADTETVNAATQAEKIITNAKEATFGYQEFSQEYPVAYGSYAPSELYEFQLDVDGTGSPRDVIIVSPETGDWRLEAIASDINDQITKNTKGFQEFSTKEAPVITGTKVEYRFKASVDGANLMPDTGGESEDFSVFVDVGDGLSAIATKTKNALENGTNGYANFEQAVSDIEAPISNLTTETSYDFTIGVDGETPVTLTYTTGTTLPTYVELAEELQVLINTEFDAAGKSVGVKATSGGLYIYSDARGTTSTISLTDGGGTNGDLFDTIEPTGTITTTDGGSGTSADGVYDVFVDADTGRVRLQSETTGSASTVAITSPDYGEYITNLLGSALSSFDGQESVQAVCEINSSSALIRITAQDISNIGTASSIEITSGVSGDAEDFVSLVGTEDAVDGTAEILQDSTDNIVIKSAEKGSSANKIIVEKTSETDPLTKEDVHTINVYYGDLIKETFSDVSLNITDDDFFGKIINAEPGNGGSEWIEIDYEDRPVGSEDGLITFPDGTYQLGTGSDEYTDGDEYSDYDYKVGTDGIPSSGGASLFVNAFDVSGPLGNQEVNDFDILITPDNGSEITQNSAIQLANFRKDFLYLMDPPFGLEYDEVVDWHNGEGYGRNSVLNNSYAAVHWSWLKDYNKFAKENFWQTPSAFIATKLVEIDNKFGPWSVAAGDNRGKLIAIELENSPSKVERDVLYNKTNRVNPIVKFTGKGIEVYGQKTTLRGTSALRNIHVRRTVIYIKKLIKNAMEGIVFEAHTQDSWNRAVNYINSILEGVRQKGGLENYSVQINGSMNGEQEKAEGVMKGVIKIVPVGVIEHIDLNLSILNPGAEITE